MTKERTILVTGATGNQGCATARQLLARGFKVRALTQQPDNLKASLLAAAGAEVVYGNLDDPALLYSALEGVRAVFAVIDSRRPVIGKEEEKSKRLAYLAKEQGVEQYVYSSVASARQPRGVPHFEVKGRVEETIRELGFASYTFLRGTFLMESLLDTSIFPEIVSGKIIAPISPHVRLQLISADDVGKFACFSFTNPDLMNTVELDLAGDEHTFVEMAAVLSTALARKIEYKPVDMDEYLRMRSIPSNLRHNFQTVSDFWEMIGWDIDIAGLMLASRNFGIDIKTLNEWAKTVAPAYGLIASANSEQPVWS